MYDYVVIASLSKVRGNLSFTRLTGIAEPFPGVRKKQNSNDTIPIRPNTNQVSCPQNTHEKLDTSGNKFEKVA